MDGSERIAAERTEGSTKAASCNLTSSGGGAAEKFDNGREGITAAAAGALPMATVDGSRSDRWPIECPETLDGVVCLKVVGESAVDANAISGILEGFGAGLAETTVPLYEV